MNKFVLVPLVLRVALPLLACLGILVGCSATSVYVSRFEASLVCALPVEEVKRLALGNKAERFSCSYQGGDELICTVSWGRIGVECMFSDDNELVAFREYRLKPLTLSEGGPRVQLCAAAQ